MRALLVTAAVTASLATLVLCAAPASAPAASLPCKVAGTASGLMGKACDVLSNPKQLLSIGKNLVTGHLGSVINTLLGGGTPGASTALSLAAIGAWIMVGAKAAITGMVHGIQTSAAPQLGSIWFSSTYWRVAGIAALLTLPFLFAAAVQALLRSDLSVLSRAALGYLPLAMLCVGIAAPLTMLLLAATDELCSLVWTPSSSHGLTWLLAKPGGGLLGVAALVKSRFLAFLFGLFTAGGAVLVWLEVLMREAAVYVVVLLLPLAFAALVWPARRVWALRAAELLVALILSKFAIVAVLGLGGMALSHASSHGVGAILAGVVLVILAAFAPWAVLRLVPLAEVASGAASALRSHTLAPGRAVWNASDKAERTTKAALDQLASRVALATPTGNGGSPLSNGRRSVRSEAPAEPLAAEADAGYDDPRDVFAGTTAEEALGPEDGSVKDEHAAATMPRRGATRDAAAEERVPGAAPMWQAPDMSWRPLTLGNDEGWPPPPLWSQEDLPSAGGGTHEVGDPPAGSPLDPASAADEPAVERPDPLPPGQDLGGPL